MEIEALATVLGARKGASPSHNCMRGCVISCSQVYTDADGKFLTSGLEFETIGLVGSNCEIDDLDAIARIDGICDDLGLDTIDIGGAAGVAMEAGKIPWGDGTRLLEVRPESEEGHRLLMRVFAESGRRADSLRQYDACELALRGAGMGARLQRLD